jgi:hypothetical protein
MTRRHSLLDRLRRRPRAPFALGGHGEGRSPQRRRSCSGFSSVISEERWTGSRLSFARLCRRHSSMGLRLARPAGCSASQPAQSRGLLHWPIVVHGEGRLRPTPRSNCRCQLAERDSEPKVAGLIGCDLIVSATQILDKGMPRGEYPKPGQGLDPAHRA